MRARERTPPQAGSHSHRKCTPALDTGLASEDPPLTKLEEHRGDSSAIDRRTERTGDGWHPDSWRNIEFRVNII